MRSPRVLGLDSTQCHSAEVAPGREMNYSHRPSKVVIVGASGCGKTTLWLRMISDSKADFKFVFDSEGEFADRAKVQPAYLLTELTEQTTAGLAVYDPVRVWPGRSQDAFDFFCDYVLSVSATIRGKKLFCCDELQRFVGSGKEEISPELSALLETGRRYELDFLGIAQSANLINTRLRNQLTRIISFRQSDERAVRFLEQNGFDAEAVRGLKPGQYIDRDLQTGQTKTGRVF